MHHIQKSILDRLSTATQCRYSDLKPAELDGNVFNYHLKLLIGDKLVGKSLTGDYTLTPAGEDYIVHRYENPLLQAHSIFLIALRNEDKWLMRERLVQPLLGMSGFVHGEPVADEPLLVTAARRLKDKTGIEAELSVHSSGLIRITENETLKSFSHAIILTGETTQEISISEDKTGRNSWLKAVDFRKDTILPSSIDIINSILREECKPFDLTYKLH